MSIEQPVSAAKKGRDPEQIREAFNAANENRDYSIYTQAMDAALEAKAQSLFPLFTIDEGDVIVDAGSGTGALAELAAKEFRGAHVYALDLSHELQVRADETRALTKLVYGDASKKVFPENSVKVKYYSTSGHEIESFGGAGRMREAIENTFQELVPGGRIIIRDFAKPSIEGPVLMRIHSQVGEPAVPAGTPPEAIDYNALSTRALLDRFKEEFRGGGVVTFTTKLVEGVEYVSIDPEWAHEFYLRKDYTANWRQEIKEKYTYWKAEEAEAHLAAAGYVHVRVIPDPNQYILKNRLEGKISLYQQKAGELQAIPFPPTHFIIVGEKPLTPGEKIGASPRLPEAVDYRALLSSISIDREHKSVRIGEDEFLIESAKPQVGSKKWTFKLQGRREVLKIVRPDTHSHHNVFKSFSQVIDREHILDSYGVPHMRITGRDPAGPPYRYYTQEMAEHAVSVADLVRTHSLEAEDIRQIAAIINKFEKGKVWQLDTNPHNWFRVAHPDGTSSLTYVDGKVYRYDEKWEFKRVGLLQWVDPSFIQRGAELSAAIPQEKEVAEFHERWKQDEALALWRSELDSDIAP
jgi:ubiquinone/menaquinone biosynthesis C-methylase UbiE